MTIASLEHWSRGPWLSAAEERDAGSRMAADLRIKMPGLGANIGSLSGGNQQKVVMAKCLLTAPRVLLLDEPTRGVDVGAKREIHGIVRRMAASGMAILLVSSELEEIRAVADRILVMSRGFVSAEFQAAGASEDALALAASTTVDRGPQQI
jgi:erythritol transport system ATP-binding protein